MRHFVVMGAAILAVSALIALALIIPLVPLVRPTVPEPVDIPTGHDTATTEAYYQYLFANRIRQIEVLRTDIYWGGPFWIAFWLFMLTAFFFFYARYVNHVHREKGELYGAASFAGAIYERIGLVSLLNILLIIVLTLSSIYMIIVLISRGFLY